VCVCVCVCVSERQTEGECVFKDESESMDFLNFFLMGWDWIHLVLRPLFGLLYQPRDERWWWWWLWSNQWNENWQGKPKYLEKTCLSATLPTTNPTWPDPRSKPGRRHGKPTTNRLSYGTALESTDSGPCIKCNYNSASLADFYQTLISHNLSKQNKLRDFSPQANYTDGAIAACRRN
jgi:hypothetical protein